MEIRVLRYFLTVAREETISRAADILHITQPTLSRQLSQMEEDMGVRSSSGARGRSPHRRGPPPAPPRRGDPRAGGQDRGRDPPSGPDPFRRHLHRLRRSGRRTAPPDLIRPFTEHYPSVTFDLYTASADHIRNRLDRGVTDIGLLLEPVNMEKYDYVRLSRHEEWVVILPPDSPLAQRRPSRRRT